MTWLAASIDIPDGRLERYGPDEPGERTLLECSFDTQMPGGFGSASITIPRNPEITAGETRRYLLAPVTIYGQGGDVAWDGRVADIGEVGVDAVQMQLEGWSAHLEDAKDFRCVYVTRDLQAWTEPSIERQIAFQPTADFKAHSVGDDLGGPGIKLDIGGTSASTNIVSEAMLDMGAGEWVATMGSDWENPIGFTSPTAVLYVRSVESGGTTDQTADLATGPTSGSITFTPAAEYRYAFVYLTVASASAPTEVDRPWFWRDLYVVGGSHGAEVTSDGVLASDVVEDVVTRAAPLLTVGEIKTSTYRIPHLVIDRTTPLAVIEQVSGLDGGEGLVPDWGIWEGREFFWTDAGTTGKTWRVRTEINADPQDEGPTSVGRASHAIVTYTDANGRELSIGPVGSGCDTETDELLDTDPENPYNRAGISASIQVDAGTVQDPDGATLIGKLALREANADPRAGSINVVGEARDEDGHTWPAYKIRAGDQVVVESDADDPLPRRIGQTSFDGQHTLTATVSTPRSQLAVLLARLVAETA